MTGGRRTGLRLAAVMMFVLVTACPVEIFDPPPLPDAGDEAFVRRLVPVMWGRNPLSIREVDLLVQVIEQSDRPTLVRAMTHSPDYIERWSDLLMDSLFINRTGERGNAGCYGRIRLENDDGTLAEWVRDRAPDEEPFAEAWSMADLIRSSLRLDDLSPIYRVHLFSQMAKDIPLGGIDAATIIRRNLWEHFEQTYLNRSLTCMPCHNSVAAVTDHEDPSLDRSWPIDGGFERAIFGSDSGRNPEDLYTFFRKHQVLGGYDVESQQYDQALTGCFGSNGPGCDGCACEEYVCDERPECCTDSWQPACVQLCNEAELGCTPALPEEFDGCTALYGYEGCGDCACQQDVCSAIPGCCEESWTEFCAERCRLWHPDTCEYAGGYDGAWDFGPDAIAPWGIHPACGKFNPPSATGSDPLNHDGYFITDYGPEASIWDIERPLREGFEGLRDGLDMDETGEVGGAESLAYLVSARLSEVVWKDVYGTPLTLPNHFPRNEAQRDMLQSLTEAFIDGGFSLANMIVVVTSHPDFNPVAPSDLEGEEASPYAMEQLYNPWVVDHEDPVMRYNNPGDIVHRKGPRVLVSSVTAAMQWPQWPQFPAPPDAGPEGRLQEDMGFFLTDSMQGFQGNDFQGLMAWEFVFGACTAEHEIQDGCSPRAGAGCDGCSCEYAVCMTDPDCCDVRWDARCAGFCGDAVGGCGAAPDAPEPPPMWMDVLLEELDEFEAEEDDATLEDAVLALKDRLLAVPVIYSDRELELLEALLEQPLDTSLGSVDDLEGTLRWACSAFLASPEFQIAAVTMPDMLPAEPRVEVPGSSFEEFCVQTAALFEDGELECSSDQATLAR
ncbi:MAG: hypothetical protein GY898_16220 [Proteobacteria bacterium]|nr:hypothetical protein [Pseudomonadota bacterium]